MANHEGYRDDTADRAVKNVVRQHSADPDAAYRNNRAMVAIRAVAEACGLEIVGRIALRDKESGWVFM